VWEEVVALRLRILRTPLGLTFTSEELEAERDEIQIAARQGESVVGCLLLMPKSPTQIKMRQVAVDTPLQGQGIGKDLVLFAEKTARERGFQEIVLNARENVVPFYERLGYTIVSDRFIEVTIPHFTMQKTLF
jgi:N-acetylglutamate synthase-like GNAT family acetyltransferase